MPRKKTKTTKEATKRAAKALHQTHGKVEKSKPSTLDQVWGDTGQSRYGTLNKKEYAQKVTDWTMTELQAHATSVSVIPVQNREMLEKKLLKEFDRHVASYDKPSLPKPKKVSREAMKILSEGS